MKKTWKVTASVGLFILMLSSGVGASAATRTTSNYRGSFLLYANDKVTFSYNGSKITKSYAVQSAGYIFPNLSQTAGISRVSGGSSSQTWIGKYKVGGGVNTPWGTVNVWGSTSAHQTIINKSGAWSAKWLS